MLARVIFFLPVIALKSAFCANILITNDLPSPSHQLWNYALAEGLMARGHNITMLGPFTDNGKSSSKYHPLEFKGIIEHILKQEEFNLVKLVHNNPVQMMKLFIDYALFSCNYSYHTNSYEELLNYPKDFKFDLIIFDMTLGSCQFPLIQRFNYPPAIGITAFNLPPFLSDAFGNGIYPSFVPFYHLGYSGDMDFSQRVVNYVLTSLDSINKQRYEPKQMEVLAKRRFGENMDSMENLERRISMLLSNYNPVFHNSQPLTANIIPVGGLHLKPAERLPKDLQTIMDNAKHGVILFALGTNQKPHEFSADKRDAFLGAFEKLNQTVIWKYSGLIDNLPKNVILRKWLPQNDILGHPNLKLFITHGGSLSTEEAAYHGVPILGMPFFIDQFNIIYTMVGRKQAAKIEFNNLTAQNFFDSINEVLVNPIYSKNIKELSRRLRDEPQTPLERAVFWIEYAMRHDGAHFLNPKSRDMSLFVSSSTDVKLVLAFVASVLIYFIVFVVRKTICMLKYDRKTKEKLN